MTQQSMRKRRAADPELRLAKEARAVGVTRAEYLDTRTRAMERSARENLWPRYALAAAVADIHEIATEVFGAAEDAQADGAR